MCTASFIHALMIRARSAVRLARGLPFASIVYARVAGNCDSRDEQRTVDRKLPSALHAFASASFRKLSALARWNLDSMDIKFVSVNLKIIIPILSEC